MSQALDALNRALQALYLEVHGSIVDDLRLRFQDYEKEIIQSTYTTTADSLIRDIDGKFSFIKGKIRNKVSGEPIPEDEPLFLLRGRDRYAYETLMHYLFLNSSGDDLHQEGIKEVIRKFIAFATEHPERMKQPGITRHLKLDPFSLPEPRE